MKHRHAANRALLCEVGSDQAVRGLCTALIGHRYWTKTGADRVDSMDGFYKNLSIMGGFLLLHITGAGQYSIDALYGY
jgi:putative oxidoreductase